MGLAMIDQTAWSLIAGLAVAYTFLRLLLRLTQDEKEPKALATSIPFIGPLFGLGIGKTKFFLKLRDQYGLPIYTLRMPGARTYVIDSLSLIPPLQRQPRVLSFHPIEHRAAEKIMGLTPQGCDILGANMNHEDSYLGSFVKALHPALSPGAGLDEITRASVQLLRASFDTRKTTTRVDLFQWIRHEMMLATTNAIYGPHNIFKNPKHEAAWWTFEPGFMQLMAWPWPFITARASFQARESLVPDMMEYFVKGYHEEGSPLVKCRFAYNTQHGLGLEDMARGEIGQTSAAITNTIPASFWFVWHIFSDPAVLRDCCREVEQLVTRDASTGICTLDLGQVKSSCPVLLSTWQETLRYRHTGLQARVVMEDHLFDGRYLLKKGATVMVVTPALHSEASVWGPDSTKFDHRRFLRDWEGHTGAMKRPSPAAFRGFGGGSTLCPGRHFVTNEILCFAALLISRFDIRPVKGVWREPGVGLQLTDALPKPIEPIEVEIVPKAEPEWKVLLPTTIKVEMGEAEM